jgi:hypothetical protein
MTNGAVLDIAMFGKLLTDGGGTTDVGLNRRHIHWRLGGWSTEDAL